MEEGAGEEEQFGGAGGSRGDEAVSGGRMGAEGLAVSEDDWAGLWAALPASVVPTLKSHTP